MTKNSLVAVLFLIGVILLIADYFFAKKFPIIINSPDNTTKVCLFEHESSDWIYTIVTCDCEKDLKDILEDGNYLSTKNKAFDGWECLLKWENNIPVLYTPSSRFKVLGDPGINHIEVGSVVRMYNKERDNPQFIKISQSCLDKYANYCIR